MRKNLDSGVLHAMRAFVSVVDAGGFSQAGERLDLTTAQVSRLVGELERRLNAKLLHRSTRQRALTDVGATYLEQCREVLSLVAEAEAQASGSAVQPSGCLRVQCMTNFGQRYVSPLLPEFLRRHPAVRIEYSTSQYVPNLIARGIDVSIYLAEALGDSGSVSRRLGTTFSILCASPTYIDLHDLPKTPADLPKHTCLQAINPSVGTAWRLQSRTGETHEATPISRCTADAPDVIRGAVEAGLGIALLPLFSVIDSVRSGSLVRVMPEWRSPDIGVFGLMPSRKYLEAKTRAWMDYLQETMVPAIEADTRYFK